MYCSIVFHKLLLFLLIITADSPVNQLYVLTRERIISKTTYEEITQEIIRAGYPISNLVVIDHTKIIEEKFEFETSYFYPSTVPYSRSKSISKSIIKRRSSQIKLPSIIPTSWQVKTFVNQQVRIDDLIYQQHCPYRHIFSYIYMHR